MAGLGRKVWTAGEVLAAADVNGYSMDQTVMVFDDATARTSAIGTPAEGMMSYTKDDNAVQVYNGTAWQSFAENAFGNTYPANSSFSVVYTATAGANTINLGDLAIDGGVFSDENSPTNRMSLALGAISYNLGGL